MKRQTTIVAFGFAIILAGLASLGLTAKPALADTMYQDSPCGITLSDAASDANIVADTVTWSYDQSDPEWACEVNYEWRVNESFWSAATFKIARWHDETQNIPPYSCQGVSGCEETTFHEFPAKLEEGYMGSLSLLWYVERAGNQYILLVEKDTGGNNTEPGEVMELAEALWLAADPRLPWGEGNPGNDPGSQPDGGDVPIIPEDQSGDQVRSLGPIATTAFVPLTGALTGTFIGWLVSIVLTNWSTLKIRFTSQPQAGTESIPSASLPKSWQEWEDQYIARELPTYRGPDPKENSSVHISVEDAKIEVIQYYSAELSPESKARVESAKMKKMDAAEFDAEYLKAFGKDTDYGLTSAFVNPQTKEMRVCSAREINYTPVHELMHVASNPSFGKQTSQALDEAVTEYFTLKITNERKIVRSSEYDELGSTDVVVEIVKSHGEALLRKAYFGSDEQGIAELRKALDQRLGPGALQKVAELMDRQYAPPKQMALDLLRGKGIRR